jgi:hypothetical protein
VPRKSGRLGGVAGSVVEYVISREKHIEPNNNIR